MFFFFFFLRFIRVFFFFFFSSRRRHTRCGRDWSSDVCSSDLAIFAVGWLNLVKAGYSGVLPSLISEQFPVETRAVGVAFSYSISVTIFGGFAPFVATWLIAATGDSLSPSYYLMFTALLSIAALMAVRW